MTDKEANRIADRIESLLPDGTYSDRVQAAAYLRGGWVWVKYDRTNEGIFMEAKPFKDLPWQA